MFERNYVANRGKSGAFHLGAEARELGGADHAAAPFDGVCGMSPGGEVAGKAGLAQGFDARIGIVQAHGVEAAQLIFGHDLSERGVGVHVENRVQGRLAGFRRGGAGAIESSPDFVHGKGFENKGLEGTDNFARGRGGAHCEQNGFVSAGCAELPGERLSTEPRHLQVGEDDVGAAHLAGMESIEGGVAGFMGFDAEACVGGQHGYDLAAEGVVVDDHHP